MYHALSTDRPKTHIALITAGTDERIVGLDRFWIVNNLGAAYLRAGDLTSALERHAQARELAAALPVLQRAQAIASNAINTGNTLLEADRIDDLVVPGHDDHRPVGHHLVELVE